MLTASDDREAFTDALGLVELTAGRADFAGAFALAESLETASAEIGYVLLTDGGLTEAEQRLQPPGTVYRRIGARDLNRAITAMTVEQRGSELHARGDGEEHRWADGVAGAAARCRRHHRRGRQVELKPGVAVDAAFDVPLGDRVEAFLDGADLLAADDHAVAVAGRRPELDVLLVGEPLFVGELLAAIPGVTVDDQRRARERPATATTSSSTTGSAVPADVDAPFLAIAPPGGAPGVTSTGTLDRPAVTLLRSRHPLLDGLDLTTVAIATAQRVEAPARRPLVAAVGGPLLLTGTTPTPDGASLRFVYLTFALSDSNLPVQLVFPLLGDRVLTELAGTGVPASSLEVGADTPRRAGRGTNDGHRPRRQRANPRPSSGGTGRRSAGILVDPHRRRPGTAGCGQPGVERIAARSRRRADRPAGADHR